MIPNLNLQYCYFAWFLIVLGTAHCRSCPNALTPLRITCSHKGYEQLKDLRQDSISFGIEITTLFYKMLISRDPKPEGPANLPSRDSTESYWLRHPTPFIQHHRTTPSLPPFAQVIIIGSGISGAFAARELLRDDARAVVNSVLMLEAREACSGATGRVCRFRKLQP